MLRILKWIGIGLAALIVAALIPVVFTETVCTAPVETQAEPFKSVLDPADRREEVNTYLTYPEWSIVHAYEDFAAVTRQGSESDFGYFGCIGSYWTNLCRIRRLASSRAPVPVETKTMLYIIGISFAAEMGIKGFYEETVGRVTAWLRGPVRTPEDEFALKVADEYALFLRQTPWYRFPFGAKLKAFWVETPLWGGNAIRKIERRGSLSLEYAVKAVYAKALGALAGLDPAPLKIRSVVSGLDQTDTDADPRITVVKTLDDGRTVIETPRYRAFTEIMRGLAARGRNFTEIAGNDDILVTVKVPPGERVDFPGTKELFEVPIQAQPGWRRIGLDVKVPALTELIRKLATTRVELEHVYDY
jgi:hypothetical protein